jgi:hypothetical protein
MFSTTSGCVFHTFFTFYKTTNNLNSTLNRTLFQLELLTSILNSTHITTTVRVNAYSQVSAYGIMILIIN